MNKDIDLNFEELSSATIDNKAKLDNKSINEIIDNLKTDQVAYSARNCSWTPPV